NKPTIAWIIDSLWINDIQSQAISKSELLTRSPRVLRVVEMAPLFLTRVVARADETFEKCYITDQKCRDSKPLSLKLAVYRSACPVLAKREFPGAMIVARHSQVKGAPNIDAELK